MNGVAGKDPSGLAEVGHLHVRRAVVESMDVPERNPCAQWASVPVQVPWNLPRSATEADRSSVRQSSETPDQMRVSVGARRTRTEPISGPIPRRVASDD